MKRTVIFAVSLLAVVFGSVQCKSASDEELVAKFQADMQALVADYNAEIERISTDTTLTDDSRMEAIRECYDSTTGTLVDMGRDIIGKYPSKSVAVAALQEIYMFLEPDEAEALLNQIQSPADTAQLVVSLRESSPCSWSFIIPVAVMSFDTDAILRMLRGVIFMPSSSSAQP